MQVRLLGTAAGGGSPQWNCHCAQCVEIRAGSARIKARLQSGVAISADGIHWFLLNASPDLPAQIESFPPLLPFNGHVRGTAISGILLTNADLDHTLGLFLLREGSPLDIHATHTVRRALNEGLALESVLRTYCGVRWHVPDTKPQPLCIADGQPSGILYSCFTIPGKPPRYFADRANPDPGDSIGYRFLDTRTGGRLLFLPDASTLENIPLDDCDVLLLDGTFWSDDEMERAGAGKTTATQMGHLPIGGPHGSLVRIANLPISRRIYMHINNTNPCLMEDSPERQEIVAVGVELGYDGLHLSI